MTEERLEPAETQNNAVNIVQILISFECPKTPNELSEWINKVKLLQILLSRLWQDDRTGKVMVECLNVLYDVSALNQGPVSPAVWSVLDLIEEDKISEIVEGILNDPNTNEDIKVQNALIAILDGLCQYGPKAPRLQHWAIAIIQGLQQRKKLAILTTVAECTITKLISSLSMPLFKPLTSPVIRLFLCSVMTPHAFLKRFPEVALASESLALWDPKDTKRHGGWLEPGVSDCHKTSHIPYKGLINQGNTCFMNSVLQILYMTTRFRNELLMKDVDASERAASDLQQLFAFMQESSRSVLEPNKVIDSTLPPTFRRGHQQDSSEYLIYLLDILHENENKIIRRRKQGNYSPFRNSPEIKMENSRDCEEGAASMKEPEENDNTIIERLFGGVTMSTTICSFCEKSFPKNDSFRDLHLSIPDDQKTFDLQELIDVTLRPEELCSENMYDCSNCGTKRNATRKQTITKAPEHLILTLKLFRFDPVRKQRLKLHSRLRNAKTIELPVLSASQFESKVVTYDVKGVVLHSGASLDGGHYFSSAVDQFGQWYLFNDSVVSVAKYEWSGGGGTPYIFVLRQSNVPDPPKNVLSPSLQLLVNWDNQRYMTERRHYKKVVDKKDYDDNFDDSPPSNDSLGGPGPSLVF